MRCIIGAVFGLVLSIVQVHAQYLTPPVNSPLFPSTPSAGMVPMASSPSAADWTALSTAIDTALGSTRGTILERGSGGWGLIGPGSIGLPLVSGGAGADPTYRALVSQIFTPTTAKADALTPTDSLTISQGSTSLTTGTSRFTVNDVGKTISIPGIGPSIAYATAVAAGSGYTNGLQTLTVSGGTCVTQPQISVLIVNNVVALIEGIANSGNCSAQPANPVSFTGGGGSGATMNLVWVPLTTTIASFTSGTQITLGTASSLSLSATSTKFVYGTDDRSALQSAINLMIVASSAAPASLQLCGSYLVGLNGTITLTASTNNPGISIVGVCPGTQILYTGIGTGASWGLFVAGTGAQTASTTIASNASQGSGALALTSAASFNVGDYIQITNNTSGGGIRGEFNQIKAISSNTISLVSALSFDTDTTQTNSVANAAVQERATVSDLTLDCTFAQGGVSGAVFESSARSTYSVQTKGCNTQNSRGVQTFDTYAAFFDLRDSQSGNLGATDAILIQYAGASFARLNVNNANGFGINIEQTNRSRIDAISNSTLGRGVKLYGSSSNFGSVSSTLTPLGNAGFTAFSFDGGSSYNHFSSVTAEGAGGVSGAQGVCIWWSGIQNFNNTIDRAAVANCPFPVLVGTSDTGNIQAVEYGTGASAGSNVLNNVQIINTNPTPASVAINTCTLAGAVLCTNGESVLNGETIVSAALSNAFSVASSGTAFNVDASAVSLATGINIKGAAAGGGAAISVLSSGTNEPLTIDAKGSSLITIGGVSTGGTVLGTSATSPLFNASTAASGYQLGGTKTLYVSSSIYTALNDPSGSVKFFFGNASDATTYMNNDNYRWRAANGTTQLAALNSTGLASAGSLTVGTTTPGNGVAGTILPIIGTTSKGATIAIGAPGAGYGGIIFGCGTNAGTAGLYAGAGTSTTATRILDNIGAGVTGC